MQSHTDTPVDTPLSRPRLDLSPDWSKSWARFSDPGLPGEVTKHDPGTTDDLASEIEDLIHTALALLNVYSAAPAFDRLLKRGFAKALRDQA